MTTLADAIKGCIKYGDFELASGKRSRYYIDIKKASTDPRILKLIARSIKEILKLHSISADYIGCVALGGVPIAVAVSLEIGLPLVIIRKETKDYGTKGQIVGEIERGKSVLLVEDVTTTGGSVLKAVKILRDEGLVVRHVISVVDREEGASDSLADSDVGLLMLFNIGALLES